MLVTHEGRAHSDRFLILPLMATIGLSMYHPI